MLSPWSFLCHYGSKCSLASALCRERAKIDRLPIVSKTDTLSETMLRHATWAMC